MKFKARIDQLGELRLSGEGFGDIGEVELDVKPAKKWVKREADAKVTTKEGIGNSADILRTNLMVFGNIPRDARNIKITYEVEE